MIKMTNSLMIMDVPLNIVTYNCTGLGYTHRAYINYILDVHKIDVLMLQETWLLDVDMASVLSSIHDDYLFTGVSGMNSSILLQGRPYGGTAIL